MKESVSSLLVYIEQLVQFVSPSLLLHQHLHPLLISFSGGLLISQSPCITKLTGGNLPGRVSGASASFCAAAVNHAAFLLCTRPHVVQQLVIVREI